MGAVEDWDPAEASGCRVGTGPDCDACAVAFTSEPGSVGILPEPDLVLETVSVVEPPSTRDAPTAVVFAGFSLVKWCEAEFVVGTF